MTEQLTRELVYYKMITFLMYCLEALIHWRHLCTGGPRLGKKYWNPGRFNFEKCWSTGLRRWVSVPEHFWTQWSRTKPCQRPVQMLHFTFFFSENKFKSSLVTHFYVPVPYTCVFLC